MVVKDKSSKNMLILEKGVMIVRNDEGKFITNSDALLWIIYTSYVN